MKNQWSLYSTREKQYIVIGTLVVFIFLLINFMYLPLQHKAENLRKELTQNQKLLLWMQNADNELNKSTPRNITRTESGSLLSNAQILLNQSPLINNLGNLQQVDDHAIEISFKEAEFKVLMNWLVEIHNNQGWYVSKISLRASKNPGIVNAELTIQGTS